MKQGLSIMEDVFPESDETASIRVMFDDLTADQISEIKAQLEAIPNVSGVAYEAGSEEYNKDNHTLFVVNSRYDYDTDEEHAIEAAIKEGFTGYTMAYENNDVPGNGASALGRRSCADACRYHFAGHVRFMAGPRAVSRHHRRRRCAQHGNEHPVSVRR